MKKIFLFLVVFLTVLSSACWIIDSDQAVVYKEYNGEKVLSVTYQTVDYNGGYTRTHLIDLSENKYYFSGYIPFSQDSVPTPELRKEFSEEEEKTFIDGIYSMGLFDINDNYSRSGVIDGGGWTLTIEFADGSKKVSNGSNSSPEAVFDRCSTYFYDLCGDPIIGLLPEYYISPPNIDVTFLYTTENGIITSDNALACLTKGNYQWNKSFSSENDYYRINDNVKYKNRFNGDLNYKLILYTANYHYKSKFKKITIKTYDFNENLSNENVLHSGGWFKQTEFPLETDKIYVYTLTYDNGDYVDYTFSTFVPDDRNRS